MKNIAIDDKIFVNGVDVSDHVEEINTHHRVGDLVTATVTFQGVRVTDETVPGSDGFGPRVRHTFHLVERA